MFYNMSHCYLKYVMHNSRPELYGVQTLYAEFFGGNTALWKQPDLPQDKFPKCNSSNLHRPQQTQLAGLRQ